MHAELAEGARPVDLPRHTHTERARGRRGAGHVEAPWLDGDVASATLMDPTPGATAQVTPRELTEALADGARRLGADIRTGMRVVGVATAPGGGGENEERVATGVRCVTEGAGEKEEEELVEADAVLVCMGVWSAVASEWFGLPRDAWPLTGIKSTHVVWQSRRAVREDPYALFCAEDEVRAASARVRAQERKCACAAHTLAHTLTLPRRPPARTHARAHRRLPPGGVPAPTAACTSAASAARTTSRATACGRVVTTPPRRWSRPTPRAWKRRGAACRRSHRSGGRAGRGGRACVPARPTRGR